MRSITLILIPLIFLSSCESEDSSEKYSISGESSTSGGNYYEYLRQSCKNANPLFPDELKWCMTSVKTMEDGNYRRTNTSPSGCPEGMKANGYTHLGGLTWCEPVK